MTAAPATPAPLYLIDAIGPFFRGWKKRTVNWSKIPFANIETAGPGREEQWARIRREFDAFCAQASHMGFNAISLDDVPHLADHAWYSLETRAKIARWRELFSSCFAIANRHGLQVFLTMDVFTATPDVREAIRRTQWRVESFLAQLLDAFFTSFPEVAGVIMRIGEADGHGVHDEFRSQLHLLRPRQVNRFLKQILPVFEKHQRTLIFRTWTVGAHRIGDLIWSRQTLKCVLHGIENHPSLILSLKYGESDFFRYLPLNQHFFNTSAAKIVELQTRREYEGCGEFPSFVGWEYERYARQLEGAPNMRGCMVWCQTGGWVPFRRLALLDDNAVWTDLNTFVTLRIVRDRQPVETAVRDFARTRNLPDGGALLTLLRLSDEVIGELLYVKEFAQQQLFFRRVRIPPILSVYWNNLFINHSVKKLLCHFVGSKDACLRAAQENLEKFQVMKTLAARAGLPVEDIEFMEDTFKLFALARSYYYQPFTPQMEAELRAAKRAYKEKYPKDGPRYRYRVKIDLRPLRLKSRHLGWTLALLMRRQSRYRLLDFLFTLNGLSMIYRLIDRRKPEWIPQFARKSAMGVETVFR